MAIDEFARLTPDKPATIMGGSGEVQTFKSLSERSMRLAHYFRAQGLGVGDHIAVMMENNIQYTEICWGATRAGLRYTPINWHLSADEACYIVNDCGAQILITSRHLKQLAEDLVPDTPNLHARLMVGGPSIHYEDYETALQSYPAEHLDEEIEGGAMMYSSGTTGRPKGILRPLAGTKFGAEPGFAGFISALYGFSSETTYLSPAPLYHAAPIAWSMCTQRLGGTAVIMERFDAEDTLRLIQEHKITHAQFVPTMFVRMLKLPEETRLKYDVSSLQMVVHAAAPCPVEAKEKMIDWWGPLIFEFYAGSEGMGFIAIDSETWLQHRGSVGRPVDGGLHIVDDDGEELPTREIGTIYFSGKEPFEYHNDPKKTASVFNDKGWGTLGDIGYVDEEGFLYLTDRKANMIISGGVNIYPQETEHCLTMHPKILDAAVIGIPNEEFGEEVKAIIQLVDHSQAGPDLEQEIIGYCRDHIAHYKCPRSIEFTQDVIRLPTGKLQKHRLQEVYAPKTSANKN